MIRKGHRVGRLTTHVLDTAAGKPAAGLALTLTRESDGALLAHGRTNADGRLDAPLLDGTAFVRGTYRLEFAVGDYLRAQGVALPDPAFLDIVPIRFGIADETAHYHVPLLVSPYGYATYRGS
jgi:5-hydroxyisourate hydrolase